MGEAVGARLVRNCGLVTMHSTSGVKRWPLAASRVFIKAHYPTDVAASALVGIVGVLLIRRWFALRRLGFSIGVDGQLHQYPGPSWKRIKSVARELLA